MQQAMNIWTALTPQRRIMVSFATIGMFVMVLVLARVASSPNMTLLYAGLENGQAGEVVSALEQRGVAYEVRGGAIFVDSPKRDELRMTLASEGLPTNTSRGYELLDSLTGFGTTSQMFDAAYWRAKEGELARTITAGPNISSARVHIANAGSNPFQRDIKPSASVSVTTGSGGITPQQARALKYLIASAVAGMSPDDVAVIDGQGGLISGGEDPVRAPDSEDKAAALRERVQRLIEAKVGRGNAVVEVSVETETDSESIRERRFDPESRVAISVDNEERSNQSTDQGGSEVTVASNLPDGDAEGSGQSQSQNSETRERINYEVSETEREIVRGPGAVKRLSVAVLVNGTIQSNADGQAEFSALPNEQLSDLRELVASAVGFDEERGDVITIKSMQFEALPVPTENTPVSSLFGAMQLDMMRVIQMAVLGLVALVLGLFVVRPILTQKPPQPLSLPPAAPDGTQGYAQTSQDGLQALTGEIADDDDGFTGSLQISEKGSLEQNAGQDPVARLRSMIGERQEETVEILRSWLDEKEERA